MPAPLFRFDFNSPYSYLAATRIDDVLGPGVEWQPIAFGFLLHAQQRTPWSFDLHGERAAGVAECERRAAAYGLPAMHWPADWPRDSWSVIPLRAAVAAERAGSIREFSLALCARTWGAGESWKDVDVLAAAARDAGLDEAVIRDGLHDPAVKQKLKDDTDAALAAGVHGVPTVTIGDTHFWGDDQLESAAAAR